MQTTVAEVKIGSSLTLDEMQEICKFRSQIFEEVYQLASEKPEMYSFEQPDEYDEQSCHFIIRSSEDGAILAYARTIFDQIKALPMFKYCTTPLASQKTAVEISRLCIHKSYRGDFTASSPFCTLFTQIIKYSLVSRIDIWYGHFLIKFYYAAKRLFRVPLQRLGDRQRFSESNDVYACSLSVAEMVDRNQSTVYGQHVISELKKSSECNELMAQKLAV